MRKAGDLEEAEGGDAVRRLDFAATPECSRPSEPKPHRVLTFDQAVLRRTAQVASTAANESKLPVPVPPEPSISSVPVAPAAASQQEGPVHGTEIRLWDPAFIPLGACNLGLTNASANRAFRIRCRRLFLIDLLVPLVMFQGIP